MWFGVTTGRILVDPGTSGIYGFLSPPLFVYVCRVYLICSVLGYIAKDCVMLFDN